MFIFAALFFYEDEERRIQNKVEEWWIKLSDMQRASRSRAVAFMQEVARLTGHGFDSLMGERVLSLRFIFTSICFSIASIFLFGFLVLPFVPKAPAGTTTESAFLWFLFFVALPLVPAHTKSKGLLGLWLLLILVTFLPIVGIILRVSMTRGVGPAARGLGYLMLALGFSLFCDLSYIVITRWMLRRVSKIDRLHEIVLEMLLNLLVMGLALLAPIFLGLNVFKYSPTAGAVMFSSFLLNSIDFIAGFAALILALLLLLHRLLWPTIQRPLYTIHRFAPIKNKKLLWTMGISLILLPTHITIEFLKSFLDKL
jgi:hypothetical protein